MTWCIVVSIYAEVEEVEEAEEEVAVEVAKLFLISALISWG
jgi:hypothetical protein